MAISKERLEELIKEGATVYSLDKQVKYPIPIFLKDGENVVVNDNELVNSVRGIYAYTGKYNGKEITVMASGMGMPSMGIYSYELYKFYDVENIIRIGSCGSYKPELKLFDIVLAENTFSHFIFLPPLLKIN